MKIAATVLAALALTGTASGSAHLPQSGSPHAIASKTCGSGYTHANLPWGEKCLHAGEFCKSRWNGRSANRYYRRYGYTCSGGRLH